MNALWMTMAVAAISLLGTAAAAQEQRAPMQSNGPRHEWALMINDAPSSVHIVSGTGKPVSGTEWSLGASNQPSASSSGMASGKTSYSDLGVTKRSPGPSPGTMSLSFDGASGGACPISVDAVKPIGGIGLVIKKNPGTGSERMTFTGVSVSRCDASGMTFSYTDMAINEKGLPGNKASMTKGSTK